jgi:predicted deacylase
MVYLIAKVQNLKMYTTTAFEKRARQPMLDKYFKEKKRPGMTCELVDEKSVTVQLKV